MIVSSRPLSRANAVVLILVLVVGLALAIQGAHVCVPAGSFPAGVETAISLSAPVCPVCALSHILVITLILILYFLVPTQVRALPVTVQKRSFLRGLRLDLRAPPVL